MEALIEKSCTHHCEWWLSKNIIGALCIETKIAKNNAAVK